MLLTTEINPQSFTLRSLTAKVQFWGFEVHHEISQISLTQACYYFKPNQSSIVLPSNFNAICLQKKETIKLPGMLLPERCAEMMCVAIANKFNTVWICANPVLVFFYWNQYMPGIFQRYIVSRIPWNKVDSQKKKK